MLDVDVLMRSVRAKNSFRLAADRDYLTWRTLYKTAGEILRAVYFLSRSRRTVVFNFHSLLPWLYIATRPRSDLILIPLYHGQESADDGGWMTKWLLHRMRIVLLDRSSMIVVGSAAEKSVLEQDYKQWFSSNAVVLISPPIGFGSEEPKSGNTYVWSGCDTALRVLTTCRLAVTKHVELLIKAAKYLQDVEITVIGDGPLRSSLDDLIRTLGLQDRVRLAGSIPDEDVGRAMRSSTIFVSLSSEESFGISVAQALSTGTP